MSRTLFSSLVGAGAGFLAGFVGVSMVSGSQPTSDTAPIIVFFGGLLAGLGAIAGALIGGSAELRDAVRQKEQAVSEEEVHR